MVTNKPKTVIVSINNLEDNSILPDLITGLQELADDFTLSVYNSDKYDDMDEEPEYSISYSEEIDSCKQKFEKTDEDQ